MVLGSIQPLEVGTCAAPAAEIHASRVVYSFAMFQGVSVIAVTQHLWPFGVFFTDVYYKDVYYKVLVPLLVYRL